MADKKKVNPLQFDKRVMHRFVQERKMTRPDAEKHLADLPDLSSQADDIAPKIYGERKGHAA
ncbi:MAG: hypothetical protein WCK42_00645 [Myxococcaceae bacterium]